MTIGVKGDNPRARAAAMYCAADEDCDGTRPVNVIVCPGDREAAALDGWKPGVADDPEPYVCIRVTPAKTVVWSAAQVHGFNEYGPAGVTHGAVDGGECAVEVEEEMA